MKRSPADIGHLARRLWASLHANPPSDDDREWLRGLLRSHERAFFDAMSAADQRHAVVCGRAMEQVAAATVGNDAERTDAVVASALHDVGKNIAGFGTGGRVAATATGWCISRGTRARWLANESGVRWRTAAYLDHPRLGAELLAAGGSTVLTVAWAREHHWPPERWSIDRTLGESLASADEA